jgi:hypothetical protein
VKIAVVAWCEQGRSACRYWDPDIHETVVRSLVRPTDLPPRVRHVGGPDFLRDLEVADTTRWCAFQSSTRRRFGFRQVRQTASPPQPMSSSANRPRDSSG